MADLISRSGFAIQWIDPEKPEIRQKVDAEMRGNRKERNNEDAGNPGNPGTKETVTKRQRNREKMRA